MNRAASFLVRSATTGDAALIARHRTAMFLEMHDLKPSRAADLEARSARYLELALGSGEYLGWLASRSGAPEVIVGGAGVQLRRTLPNPREPDGAPHGREAIVLNVYTDPACRGLGIAGLLMRRILEWAGEAGINSLVLHASTAGRPLYERMGFTATNEMRYTGRLGDTPGQDVTKERS